jgi:transcriptional regulator with XRE-family HTH domain
VHLSHPSLSIRQINAENEGKHALIAFPRERNGLVRPLLAANFPQMNFTQMHERLRLELLRRMQRGTLSVSLLARQTGFGQPHLSNFLRSRRQLSLEAMDRILTAQRLTVADLLPALPQTTVFWQEDENAGAVPVVSHATALFEPVIRPSAVQLMLHLPPGALQAVRARATNVRRAWQRFVAVRIAAADAFPMEPLVLPEALALIDRHYNSLLPYRPNRPNLYAIRNGSHLTLRYAEFQSNRLILRPHNGASPLDMIVIDPEESPGDWLVGRIALILNEV